MRRNNHFGVLREAKAVGTDHNARMQDAACTHLAVLAHGDARLEPGTGSDTRPTLDHTQRADDGTGIDLRVRMHHGTRVHARFRPAALRLAPQLGGTREVGIRVGRHDAGAALTGLLSQRGCHNDAGRLGGGQLLLVAGVAEKAQIARAGGFQGSDTCNTCFARRPLEFATKRIDDLP